MLFVFNWMILLLSTVNLGLSDARKRPRDQTRYVAHQGDMKNHGTRDSCNIRCNPSAKYRNMDGSCNNRENPCWGKSFRTFSTLLPLEYSDNIGCGRIAVPGTPSLPPVRLVSRVVHHDVNIRSKNKTQLFLMFGQFQAHDVGSSPGPKGKQPFYQCSLTKNEPCSEKLEVPAGDPFWPSPGCALYVPTDWTSSCNGTGVQCGCKLCKPGQIQYVNGGTSYFDGSGIYGSTEERVLQLRVPGSAELRMEDGVLLARTRYPKSANYHCEAKKGCNGTCFDAGDSAANSNFLLTSIYTIWFREHNRLVKKLKPNFSDVDILFEEVRKIIGAMVQHIVYAEYLPLVFGNCMPNELKIQKEGFFRYDPAIDSTSLSECNFGACRYGHSEISNSPKLYNDDRNLLNIGQFYNMTPFCDKSMVNKIVGGTTQQTTMEEDQYVATQIANEMHYPGNNFTDVISLGLKRARDHGVPSYIRMLKYCGLREPKNYEELKTYIADEAVGEYQKLYGEDGMINIDFYSAILSEKPTPDCSGILGQVTRCIVAEHHRRMKLGDRLWYENLNQPESLTWEQIQEIKKTTIARIICSNTDLSMLQERAFEISDSNNPLKSCADIVNNGDIDESKWTTM